MENRDVVVVAVENQDYLHIGEMEFSCSEEHYIRLNNPIQMRTLKPNAEGKTTIHFGIPAWGCPPAVTMMRQNIDVIEASPELSAAYFKAHAHLSQKPINVHFTL